MKEGNGLFESSKKIHAIWKSNHDFIKNFIHKKNDKKQWDLLMGLPRSSMLILGYTAEIYFKAGIVKIYAGCKEEMLNRDIKHLFGHNLIKMENPRSTVKCNT